LILMDEQKESKPTELASRFLAAGTPPARADVLREMSRDRLTHAVSKTPEFKAAVAETLATATGTAGDEHRIQAVALIGRIVAVVKSLKVSLRRQLQECLVVPLPSIALLNDADDRFYVASLLQLSEAEWIPAYVAQAAVEEEAGENARTVLLQTLLSRSDSLSGALAALVPWLRALRPETENQGDSVARRVRRLLAALRPQLLQFLGEPGNDVGEQLVALIRAGFHNVAPPESESVRDEFAEEVAGVTHDIVRTQLTLVTDASTYAGIGIPKKWFVPGLWARFAEKSPSMKLVCRDLADALILLGKQGVTDAELVTKLEEAAGSRERAREMLAALSDRNPGLGPEVREWLRTAGRPVSRRGVSIAEEAKQVTADAAIAVVLIEAQKISGLAVKGARSEAQADLTLLSRVRSLILEIERLASMRHMRVVGEVGAEVEYSPNAHQVVSGDSVGVRYVRIVSPIVERCRADGKYEIVAKAVVEPVR
jgi:hypothetical protein